MAFTQQKVILIHLQCTRQSNHTLCLLHSLSLPSSDVKLWVGLQFGCLQWRRQRMEGGGRGRWYTALIILSSRGSFTCPVSQLSITARASSQQEPRMYSALIKCASRQGENAYRAQSHSQSQLKCCSAAEEGTRGHLKVSEKPNYQLVIYCQQE